MASLQKFIDELQALENANPGSEIFLGERFGTAAFEKFGVVQRRLGAKVWKGIRWISDRSKKVAFVIEPTRKA